ncbi:MAG TPA: bifunctional 5,10-methylenetetrahydrofolate dehydrogenase/5,10-methenyltetrahydrofolate cyclohydrolase [Solirubrobacteraceae bacterium]|nr:bifunctional 5,10-methylenetetrahydrofolate dehydrogenase/5,10-methenyltetrahydrofolate cyclohydrolase [Solirubrobacteraceae bacterium]
MDGRALARELLDAVRARVAALGGPAGIATLLIGADEAARIYQRRIHRAADEVGLNSRDIVLAGDSTLPQVAQTIAELNADPAISGILILRPIPAHLPEALVLRSIPPHKDVEAQHPENAGLLALGTPRFVPSTAGAAFALLDRHMESLGRPLELAYDGVDLVIVGRSNNVGKPAAILGLARNATVISAHKHTADAGRLAEHTRLADVLIVAAGVPRLVTAEMVRPGAVVIDIGINPLEAPDGSVRLVGDVDFESVIEVASAVSPVPGGVGPITDAWVLHNAVLAAEHVRDAEDGAQGLGPGQGPFFGVL